MWLSFGPSVQGGSLSAAPASEQPDWSDNVNTRLCPARTDSQACTAKNGGFLRRRNLLTYFTLRLGASPARILANRPRRLWLRRVATSLRSEVSQRFSGGQAHSAAGRRISL